MKIWISTLSLLAFLLSSICAMQHQRLDVIDKLIINNKTPYIINVRAQTSDKFFVSRSVLPKTHAEVSATKDAAFYSMKTLNTIIPSRVIIGASEWESDFTFELSDSNNHLKKMDNSVWDKGKRKRIYLDADVWITLSGGKNGHYNIEVESLDYP